MFGLKNRPGVNMYSYNCVYCSLNVDINEFFHKDYISLIIKCISDD